MVSMENEIVTDLLRQYIPLHALYLQELLRGEAQNAGRMCAACQVTPGIICCSDCFGTPVWCHGCALEVHSALPFHRIQLWNGKCFLKTSLFEQGFMIHLGHDGHPCPAHPSTSSPWVDVRMHEPNLTREDEDIGEVVDEILEGPFFTFVPPPAR